jgi:hypothetical protein
MVAKAASGKRSARTAGRATAGPARRAATKKTAVKKAAAKKTEVSKKTVAKKPAAKKAAVKKPAAKKQPAKKVAKAAPAKPVVIDVESLVYKLVASAAERDASVVYGALPPAAIDGIAAIVPPAVQFVPPPSYRKFMAAFGSLRALDADGEIVEFCVYTPKEVAAQTRSYVRIPAGVRWEDEDGRPCTLSTDHLIAFARAGVEGRWCFDASAPGSGGELPVCYHHQDEPLHARSRESGAQVSSRGHDYPDFLAWLIGQVEEFCAPPHKRR